MPNPFLTNSALEKLAGSLKISSEKRDLLLSKIPSLDKEEREKVFNLLKEIFFLDLKEEEAITRVKKYWHAKA